MLLFDQIRIQKETRIFICTQNKSGGLPHRRSEKKSLFHVALENKDGPCQVQRSVSCYERGYCVKDDGGAGVEKDKVGVEQGGRVRDQN